MPYSSRLLLLPLLGVGLCAQSDWRLIAAGQPSDRLAAQSVWVPQIQSVVVFGGAAPSAFLDDMWAWNGAAWNQVAATGPSPSPRASHAFAYDSVRGKVVLFGGTVSGGAADAETWEWDPAASWTQMSPANAPSARTEAAMAYANGQMVLFGGTVNGSGAGARLGDTWTWDGVDWTLAATTGPTARFDHAMCADPASGNLKMFGGMTQALPSLSGYSDELWSWNGSAWTQEASLNAPPARRLHRLAFDTGRNKVLLYGGTPGGTANFADTWTWDSSVGWSQLSTTNAPSGRHAHSMSYDEVRRDVVVHGGNVTSLGGTDETWALNGPIAPQTFDWRPAGSTTPGDRHAHSLSWIPNSQSLLMFGGASPASFLNEMWRWDGASWSQTPTPATAPSPRGGHFAAYDILRNRLVVFGGIINRQSGACDDETWEWDGVNWSQRFPANKPSPRCFGGMAYGLGRVVLFGGQADGSGAGARYNDTWAWDGVNWTQVASTGPSARFGVTMAFDSVASDIKLFGGNVSGPSGTEQNDLWSWNGVTWSQIATPVAPPARRLHQMTFDRERNELIIFGGIENATNNLSDTWAYRPSTGWMEITTLAKPTGRHAPAMGYDEIRKEVVLHGGTGCTPTEATETWVSPGGFASTFGAGCPSSTATPFLSAVTRPAFGSALELRGANLAPNSFNWFVLGFNNVSWNTLPLPFNLAQLGFPIGCSLLVPDDIVFWTLSDPIGRSSLTLQLPAASSLFALPIYFQCATFDPSLPNLWPFAWSNGVATRLGY